MPSFQSAGILLETAGYAPGEGPATNLTKLPFDLAVRIYA